MAGIRGQAVPRRSFLIAAVCTLTGAAAGCSHYRMGVGSLYPCDIKTVHVPIFQSESFRRGLGERLTEAVVKQIERNTPYKVVDNEIAESTLQGRIVADTKRIVVEGPTDEPRELFLDIRLEVSWVDRRGELLRETATIPVPPELLPVGQGSSVFPEIGQSIATGHQESIEKLARQIVALMESPW